ncbi:MAG: hypothetical protein IT548_15485 [Alphaproteobacteria bacterium]|nr:hypothetical protein [Alphaproteobacteria bacterium]
MKLRALMLAGAAGIALAATASAKEKVYQVTETQLRQMIAAEVRRQVQDTGTPQGNVAELEQRVQDLEISQGSKINALQARADAVQWSFDNGRPVVATGDGRFSLAVRGRFHFDAGLYAQDPGNDVPLAVDGQNVRDLNSGSYFRRAQFGVEGKVFRDFDYEFRFNFGGAENEDPGSINILRVAYNPTPEVRINVGAIQPTFTLDDSTSSNDITFLERASVVNTVIGEYGGSDARKGIEATYLKQGENMDWMVNVAYTTSPIGTRNQVADDRDQVLGRIAARVFKNADWDVHLGANAAAILSMGGVDLTAPNTLPGARNVNFRDRPELRINGDRLVSTGNIAADGGWMWGLEAAARYKNFYLSGEFFNFGLDRDRACAGCNLTAQDPDFSGWYVMASYILTGETKRYEAQGFSNSRMQFGAPRPNSPFSTGGTWGAWEIAARYSELDLNYKVGAEGTAPNTALGEIRGGKQDIVTVALNWYLNRNMRLMFQYQNVDIDRLSSTALSASTNPTAPSSAYPNIGQTYDTFAVRTQFAF